MPTYEDSMFGQGTSALSKVSCGRGRMHVSDED